MKVELLTWDSEFFGYPVAQITSDSVTPAQMDEILEWCAQQHVKLLQFKCAVDEQRNVLLAEKHRFHFADMRLTLSKAMTQGAVSENNPCIRRANASDVEALVVMSKGLFSKSRYYYDKHFDAAKIDQFYANWLEKAVEGTFDDCTLVYEDAGEIKGFITLRMSEGVGMLGLLAVATDFKGKGGAKALLAAGERYLTSRGATAIKIATQGRNVEAQRFYQCCGYTTASVQIYYHKWF